MNGRIFTFVILLCLLTWNCANSNNNEVKNITKDSVVILNSNVMVYQNIDKKAGTIGVLNILEVYKLKKSKVVNERLEILLTNGKSGWVDANNTSYIGNLEWKKFDNIGKLELFLPSKLKFKYTKRILPEDVNGKLTEFRFQNIIYYLYIYYFIGNMSFDINSQSKAEQIERDLFIDFKFYGYKTYFRGYINDDGQLTYGMYVVEKDHKAHYWVSISILTSNPTPEQELTAKKILFSVRLK